MTLARYWLMLLLIGICSTVYAYDYPAKFRVTTTLNVRQGPGTEYYKIGKLYRDDYVEVETVTRNGSREWGTISFYNKKGYVAMQYLSFVTTVTQKDTMPDQLQSSSESSFSFSSWLSDAWEVIKMVLIVLLLLIAYAFKEKLIAIAIFVGICMGIGALVFWWLFDNSDLEATAGLCFSAIFGLRIILEAMAR